MVLDRFARVAIGLIAWRAFACAVAGQSHSRRRKHPVGPRGLPPIFGSRHRQRGDPADGDFAVVYRHLLFADDPRRDPVAGGVVDYIVISAEGTQGIRDYIRPLAIVSNQRNPKWDAPTLNEALEPMGIRVPILPGSIRGFATSAEFKRNYPARFNKIANAMKNALESEELLTKLDQMAIGSRWTGPEQSEITMQTTFSIFENYSYLLKL